MANNNKNLQLKLRHLVYLLLLVTCANGDESTANTEDLKEPLNVLDVGAVTQLPTLVQHAPMPVEPHSEIDKESDANAAANAAAAAAAVLPAPTPPTLTTTTLAPLPEPELPEYLKNCFYAEEELCLNWFNTSDTDNGTLTANNGSSVVSAAATATSASMSASTNGSPSVDSHSQPIANHSHNRDINSCQCRPHLTKANSWYCCNITHISMISSCHNIRNWTNLHIRNATMTQMDLSNSIYRSLQSLAITDGNISQLVNYFPRHSSMKCLNISNNNITDISQRAVKDSPHLEFLDISNNSLTRMPNWIQSKNITMDISGNMRMLCEPLSDAIYSDTFKFVKPEKSFCLYNATHQWFNSTDLVCIKQLERTKQCRTKCPVIPNFGNCTCSHDQIMIIQGEESKPICHVDCSNLGLVELPPKLPDNTFTLNITNNKITSLGDHFHTNPTYHNIVKLMADNNQISSIYEFEGTKFIEHFQRIYMRNNSLSKIPEYFLNNALMDTEIGRRIYLAGNRLQCDCNSAKTLQNWLKERSSDIPDYMDIKCRNLPQSVIQLQETKLCQAPPDWTDYIYYLIAAEVILLLALITKVSYDYWVFKTAGYLPWPASKMPKLPCDWLCES